METPRKDEPLSTPSSSSFSERKGIVVTPNGQHVGQRDKLPVKEPHANDVLCGRGGSINSHAGNERFRLLVEKRKRVYLTARFKREKRLIANSIVAEIRSLDPPGRFLSRDATSGTWYDIGDEKARDKTSQALRENAPSIRAEIEVEINQQRAEMQREEEEAAFASAPPGPPHPYYQQPWGYYAPYHGYSHYHPDPHRYGVDPYDPNQRWHYQGHMHPGPAPPSQAPPAARRESHGHYSPHHHRESHADSEETRQSPFEMHKFVSSVPSSLAAWTKSSFSFGGHSTSSDTHERRSSPSPAPASQGKPLAYVHQGDGSSQERIRTVHFEDDGRQKQRRHSYNSTRRYQQVGSSYLEYPREHNQTDGGMHSPIRHGSTVTPDREIRPSSMKPTPTASGAIVEPHAANSTFNDSEKDSSLLTQVANHILGSWDASLTCTQDSTQEAIMEEGKGLSGVRLDQIAETSLVDKDSFDEEGQEVELVEMDENMLQDEDMESVDDEQRMPPPDSGGGDSHPHQKRRIEIDWPSKMMGCQSTWLPETFNPPSFFSPRNNPLSPSASLEMDASAVGTEGMSCTESVGGASLCQVFSQDQIGGADSGVGNAQHGEVVGHQVLNHGETVGHQVLNHGEVVGHQVLSQMPSWERSFRSKSPSTICSDPSIVSKASDKMDGHISPLALPLSPRTQEEGLDDRVEKGEPE